MHSNQKKSDVKKILFKGFLFIIAFYLFFTIIYFLSNPVKVNNFFIYSTILIYVITIVVTFVEIVKNVKKDKRVISGIVLLALMVIVKVKWGVLPYRDIVYTGSLQFVFTNFRYIGMSLIRFFGIGVLVKLSQIIFNKISWETFTYLSSLISFLGLTAVYLISKKIYKKVSLAILSPILILLNFYILFYLGNEEFSGFAVSFLMIAYYFMLERKPLNALIAFMAAAFSRTEVFLLFPFFIAQYWYVNNIDFKIKKEFRKIKKLPLKKIIPNAILIAILCVEFWFFITNLADFYSDTSRLELFGPQPKRDKEIFTYLYYHLTYNLTSRIISNVSFIITQTFLQKISELGSIAIFALFIISSLLGLKDKRIQIFLFNILFFFVLYAIIRYDGFINGYYRYTIFLVYSIAIIVPYTLKVIRRRFRGLSNITCIFIISLLILYLLTQLKVTGSINPYDPLTKEELKQIQSNISEECKSVFISEKNPVLLYYAPPKMEIISFSVPNNHILKKLRDLKSKEECLYAMMPVTAESHSLPSFYDQVITEGWCRNKLECSLKLKNITKILEKLNFTKIISFNKSKDDLGSIYYWENDSYKK